MTEEEQELIDLVLALHEGEIEVDDLTDEQQCQVKDGYRLLVEHLKDDPEHAELVESVTGLLESWDAEDAADDDFEQAISEAVERGSIYFELESDGHLH